MKKNKILAIFIMSTFTAILVGLLLYFTAIKLGDITIQNKIIIDNQNAIVQAIKNESSINTLSQIQTLLEDNASLTLDNEYKATYIKEFNAIVDGQVNFEGMQKYYMRNGGD